MARDALKQGLKDATPKLPISNVGGELLMNRETYGRRSGDALSETLASYHLLSVIGKLTERWKHDIPAGTVPVLYLRTPTGEVMDVSLIKPAGLQGYMAEGHVNGLPCLVTGHIATLVVFCSYEEVKGRKGLGFRIEAEAPNESQPESSQTQPDNT